VLSFLFLEIELTEERKRRVRVSGLSAPYPSSVAFASTTTIKTTSATSSSYPVINHTTMSTPLTTSASGLSKKNDDVVVNKNPLRRTHSDVDKWGRPVATKFHAYDRFCICPAHRLLNTEFKEGMVIMDSSFCGVCGKGREVAALRNMSSWRAESSQTCCIRSGLISMRVGDRHRLVNRFNPDLLQSDGGYNDAYRVDSAIRREQNADKPVPEWMRVHESVKEWASEVGCFGSTHDACKCWPLCQKTKQTIKIGPDDELHLSKDRLYACTKEVDITGSNLRNVDYVSANVPVGCCGRTNDTCDPLRCNCGCNEVVSISMGNFGPDSVVDTAVVKNSSVKIVEEISQRLLHPAFGTPFPKKEYNSSTFCCGSSGSMVVTQTEVTVKRTAYPSGCCLCCWCQTEKTIMQPIHKIVAVSVENEGCIYVAQNAFSSLAWSFLIVLDNVRILNVVGAVLGLVFIVVPAFLNLLFSPLVACFCCCCQLQEVRLKGNAPDIVFKVRSLKDTDNKGIEDFAIEVTDFFRKIGEENEQILKEYTSGADKKAAEERIAVEVKNVKDQADRELLTRMQSMVHMQFAGSPQSVYSPQPQALSPLQVASPGLMRQQSTSSASFSQAPLLQQVQQDNYTTTNFSLGGYASNAFSTESETAAVQGFAPQLARQSSSRTDGGEENSVAAEAVAVSEDPVQQGYYSAESVSVESSSGEAKV
jgi:hypothetical protein